jgi:hypothetical protein
MKHGGTAERSAERVVEGRTLGPAGRRASVFNFLSYSSALTICSHIFLASPNSIIVLSR